MPVVRTVYNCSNCGVSSPKWIGKCPSCEEWNTYVEEIIEKKSLREEKRKVWKPNPQLAKAKNINDIKEGSTARMLTQDTELNQVLGGGIVSGSLILIGGQPGIGKSTLLLQLALNLGEKILYVSGEESEEQIKMRANRIGSKNPHCYIFCETNLSIILKEANRINPALIIIDSIQTVSSSFLESTPGSISQVKECTAEIQRYAKENNIPVFLVGHITKDGNLAGPKLLEHMVDVVLQFEGEAKGAYRILRTLKNRFGSTDELGIYQMQSTGLRIVENPSELLLNQNEGRLSGSAVAATIEGRRPMLIETQSLVSKSVYGTPQRSTTGFDLRRLSMLLAVLEKRCGLLLSQNDVFLNLAGGIKISDPAIDLAIVAALISSLEDVYIEKTICFTGEVGLSGEIRAVPRIEQRIQEAERLGFEQIFLSHYNLKGLNTDKFHIKLRPIKTIIDLLESLFN